jgi:hypothetical protein
MIIRVCGHFRVGVSSRKVFIKKHNNKKEIMHTHNNLTNESRYKILIETLIIMQRKKKNIVHHHIYIYI